VFGESYAELARDWAGSMVGGGEAR
jgi:hypothetical protein